VKAASDIGSSGTNPVRPMGTQWATARWAAKLVDQLTWTPQQLHAAIDLCNTAAEQTNNSRHDIL
jgi:hypothetical protein